MFKLETGTLRPVHKDARRAISEMNGSNFSLQSFEIFQSIPLGNHYHERKTETFLLIEGSGELVTQDITQKKVLRQDIEQGAVIRIEPGIAHTFVLAPGSKMIGYSSTPFDPNDMDMHAHKLV